MVAPDAVNAVELPAQMLELPPMLIVGYGLTEIVADAFPEQPFAVLVTTTV